MTTTAKLSRFALVLLLATTFSCALKPIPSDYSSARLSQIDEAALGNGKVLIYNGADILHSIDNTARLNVWIGDRSIGQIRTKEYVILDLQKGKYEFNVVHLDMVKFKSKHQVEIDEKTKVIRIEPTLTSNNLTVTNVLPANFAKYRNSLDRK